MINLKALTCLVMVNYDDFEALGYIIGVTGKKRSPDIYARIIQPTFRTSVCHIKSSMKKHDFLGINTCHCLGCLRSQLKKLA